MEFELNRAHFIEKLRLLGRLAAKSGVFMRRLVSWPFYLITLMNAKAPDQLLIAPQDIRTADPTIATEIYAGYFAFAGKVINTHGHLPFEIDDAGAGMGARAEQFRLAQAFARRRQRIGQCQCPRARR